MRRKRINKKKVVILVIIILLIISTPIFGRYVYNSIREMYLTSKKFYFNSDILGVNRTYTNWGGTEVYVVEFELYSYDNEIRKMAEDLSCRINAKINSGSATCYIESGGSTSTQGTTETNLNKTIAVASGNKLKVKVYIVPTTKTATGSSIVAVISAKSLSPYEKTLTSQITLTSTEQAKYSIRDEVGNNYSDLILSNPKEEEVTVSLTFNPEVVQIDSNDEIFEDVNTTYTTTEVNEIEYISSVNFKLGGQETKGIKFYKKSKNNNYTYEQNNNHYVTSIITVSY